MLGRASWLVPPGWLWFSHRKSFSLKSAKLQFKLKIFLMMWAYYVSYRFSIRLDIDFLKIFYKCCALVFTSATMKSLESKSIIDLAHNDFYVEDKNNSVSKKYEGKVRYQCASSIVTIPINIVRELNLQLGETIIVNIIKKDSK
jgi:hypothetical protein